MWPQIKNALMLLKQQTVPRLHLQRESDRSKAKQEESEIVKQTNNNDQGVKKRKEMMTLYSDDSLHRFLRGAHGMDPPTPQSQDDPIGKSYSAVSHC